MNEMFEAGFEAGMEKEAGMGSGLKNFVGYAKRSGGGNGPFHYMDPMSMWKGKKRSKALKYIKNKGEKHIYGQQLAQDFALLKNFKDPAQKAAFKAELIHAAKTPWNG